MAAQLPVLALTMGKGDPRQRNGCLGGGSRRQVGQRLRGEEELLATDDDELPDRAAALTYYGVLALFPALLVLVSGAGDLLPFVPQPA